MEIKPPSLLTSVPVSDFKEISDLCPTTDGECWVCSQYSTDIRLIDTAGGVLKTVSVGRGGCLGLVRADNGTIYVSCGDNSILKMTTDYKLSEVQGSLSFTPLRLAFDPKRKDLLVCGLEKGVFSVTEQEVKKGLDAEIKDPVGIAINSYGDICVADGNLRKVFLFTPDRRLLSTCTGSFEPRRMSGTGGGNFILTDSLGNCLYILNRDGDILATQKCSEKIWAVCLVSSGLVWVGCRGTGKILVYSICL